MERVIWEHADGRQVAVHPQASGTQAILSRAGFAPLEVAADPPAESAEEFSIKLPPQALRALDNAGMLHPNLLREASDAELLAVKGFGEKSLRLLRDQL